MMRPSKEQLREVIRNGNPDLDYRLLLRRNGRFELVSDLTVDGMGDYVERTETLDRGDGWVGEEAAQEDWWIDRAYKWLLPSWIKYLKGESFTSGLAQVPLEPTEKFEKELDIIMKEKRYW